MRWHNCVLTVVHNVFTDLFYSFHDADFSNRSNYVANNNNNNNNKTLRQTYREGRVKQKHILVNLFFGYLVT
jgi:hypothetical protein